MQINTKKGAVHPLFVIITSKTVFEWKQRSWVLIFYKKKTKTVFEWKQGSRFFLPLPSIFSKKIKGVIPGGGGATSYQQPSYHS